MTPFESVASMARECFEFVMLDEAPAARRRLRGPVVKRVFDVRTRRLSEHLQQSLATHAGEVSAWHDARPQ